MRTDYRYTLDKSSKKFYCPRCEKKRFVRYIDLETGEYLPDQFGKCDRADECGLFFDPYKNGYAADKAREEFGEGIEWKPTRLKKEPTRTKRYFIPIEVLEATCSDYGANRFIQNLLNEVPYPIPSNKINEAISLYYLGTVKNGYRKGAVTFPFIDSRDEVRAIQVKQFDENNHTSATDSLPSIIEKHHTKQEEKLPKWLVDYKTNDKIFSCLFGEHLLKRYPYNPVALVEAPKSAIYGTLYMGHPRATKNLLWLSTYNLSGLSVERCKPLKGRDVILFPDLSRNGSAHKRWADTAILLNKEIEGARFIVSDLLEKAATEQDKEQGKDLADVLIETDWREYEPKETKTISAPEPIEIEECVEIDQPDFRAIESFDFSERIEELEAFFNSINKVEVDLKGHGKVNDLHRVIETHLSASKKYNGKRISLAYLNRLEMIRESESLSSIK